MYFFLCCPPNMSYELCFALSSGGTRMYFNRVHCGGSFAALTASLPSNLLSILDTAHIVNSASHVLLFKFSSHNKHDQRDGRLQTIDCSPGIQTETFPGLQSIVYCLLSPIISISRYRRVLRFLRGTLFLPIILQLRFLRVLLP